MRSRPRACFLAAGLEVNPRGASARARLAVCLARAGDGDGAKEEIAKALALSPRDPRILYDVAIVTSLTGDDGKAIEWIERAVEAGCGIQQIRQEPQFASLRKDPRFDRALQRRPPKKA